MSLDLSYPQHIFLNNLNTKFRGYVGGFGSGKTFVGCLDLILFASKYPATVQAYYGPTYTDVRDIFYPTFEEACDLLGFTCDVHVGNKEVDLYRGGFYYGKIICRSMSNPNGIVGYKVARSLVDEIDTLPADKAQNAWNKIIARMRLKIDGVINGVGVTTTPEGYRFVYNRFADHPTARYSMVQASTYENHKHLPDDYIDSLLESYSAELVQAYLMGNFVNLTTGTVYSSFCRKANHTDCLPYGGEELHIGMDFNVGKMSAVIHVERMDGPRAVGEIFGKQDTADMIAEIEALYAGHTITVYPDASGKNRSTASRATIEEELKNDIALLEAAGFYVEVGNSNPRIKARVTAMNTAFCNATGVRLYLVNTKACPEYTKCLEQQAYDDNGMPDKTAGLDHMNDAGGYYISRAHPVNRPTIIPNVKRY